MKFNKNFKLKHKRIINGVEYVTVSYYSGEKDIREKIGDMITNSIATRDTVFTEPINIDPPERAG